MNVKNENLRALTYPEVQESYPAIFKNKEIAAVQISMKSIKLSYRFSPCGNSNK